jgi:hypothetical protein
MHITRTVTAVMKPMTSRTCYQLQQQQQQQQLDAA